MPGDQVSRYSGWGQIEFVEVVRSARVSCDGLLVETGMRKLSSRGEAVAVPLPPAESSHSRTIPSSFHAPALSGADERKYCCQPLSRSMSKVRL
jgi:hypothetical protein